MKRTWERVRWGAVAFLLLSAMSARAQTLQNGCSNLVVFVLSSSSQPSSIQGVSCSSGSVFSSNTQSFSSTLPAVLQLGQSAAWGPDCTVTVSQGSQTAILQVQQNYCALGAGQITASVTSGPATLQGSVIGSYPLGLPGTVFFLFTPGGAAK